MAQAAVVQAVTQTLTGWTHTPVIELNKETDETVLQEFLEPQYLVSRTKRLPINERLYEEEGYVRFILGCERGVGVTTPLSYAQTLVDLFSDKTIGGVEFKPATSPALDETNDDGPWFVLTVLVPYCYRYRQGD